jgi:uncharacterized protein Yka (UPF0111/DUF47 family)
MLSLRTIEKRVMHAQQLAAAVSGMTNRDGVFQHCAAVRQLETEADGLSNSALSELFEHEKDPIQLIKVKELITQLALATDRAKAAAEVIEADDAETRDRVKQIGEALGCTVLIAAQLCT